MFLSTVFGLSFCFLGSLLVCYPALWIGVNAYIPASPVNSTADPNNGTEGPSHLDLMWLGGSYGEDVSYQLVGANSSGVSKGALVHFSEEHLDNDTTTTPWIALVSCDSNATDASQEFDIFTEARDRGAIAALLYSLYSERCQINAEYADPENFEQLMDIFSTPSLSSSQFIEYQYGAINETKFGHYDAKLLNESAAQINTTIVNGTIDSKGFMFATLVAFNATDPGTQNSQPGNGDNSNSTFEGSSGPNTSLAMIILYAITGCVSALFCVVIVSGAIRAIRHPERYGPRSGDSSFGGPPGFGAQSRARGLTRAILDTFPVVKFGRPEATTQLRKDVESVPDPNAGMLGTHIPSANLEMNDLTSQDRKVEPDAGSQKHDVEEEARAEESLAQEAEQSSAPPRQTTLQFASPTPIPRPPRPKVDTSVSSTVHADDRDIVPDAIGRETCPICIVDFEEGDDLRVLPCEGHHRFHQQCVDQWLLELSASCPICRQDFHALETMMASDVGDHLEPPTPHGSGRPVSTAGQRFSRYLRLARRRRGRNREGVAAGDDPTNPPMPIAPETSL
ncbi:unnamed protein product [Somion occarium]|uniref:RING-type domain-containing protein n=1 Tax=Somion occarium TaxID=3059160 RepID=A0ABP1DH90_9APHY